MLIPALAVAIGPAALVMWWVYSRDRTEPEPRRLVWQTVGLGALSVVWALMLECPLGAMGVIPQGGPEGGAPFAVAFLAAAYIGLVEEAGKLAAVLLWPFRHPSFNQWMDGIVYCVAASLGFATVENVLYVSGAFCAAGPLGFALPFAVGAARAFTAVPGHAAMGVLMGLWVGAARMVASKRRTYILCGYGLAVLAHMAYNGVLFSGPVGLALFVPVLAVTVTASLFAIRRARVTDEAYRAAFWGWRTRIEAARMEQHERREREALARRRGAVHSGWRSSEAPPPGFGP